MLSNVMEVDGFEAFFPDAEVRLRRALVATYGPMVGRDAAVDALSWAWEHWERLRVMDNPLGYLYRVGQTAAARYRRPAPFAPATDRIDDATDGTRADLLAGLARLSEQQRAAVLLIHGYGLSQRETADVLGISVSTAREHLARGLDRLRNDEEVRDGR